jgi:hypothetical protein
MKYLKLFEDYTEDKIICRLCDDVLKSEEENKSWRKLGDNKDQPVCKQCIEDYYERRGEIPFVENVNNKCELCDEPITEGKYCEDCEEIYKGGE